ncbi:MAG TPA: hypothetical protein VFI68_09170 [Anaerolineales bacterium]|nr:hypothetical protein [Anaerolineales bacterium]
MKKNFLTLAIMVSISACGGKASEAAPITIPTEPIVAATEFVPIVTPVCISSDPAPDDIERALSFTSELFSAAEWERTYTVANGRVSVVWSNNPLGSLAYVEALVFPCGYEEPDLDNYYIDGTWRVIFSNYDSYEPVTACKIDVGIRLYEFKVVTGGSAYNIKYWAQNDTDTRVIGAMIVFPIELQPLMDEYAAQLFPNFTSCR